MSGEYIKIESNRAYRHFYTYGGFKFHYDTARQLAQLMLDAGVKIQNPYDPSCTDYDNFNEIIWGEV